MAEIYELIQRAQTDISNIMELVDLFNPLIKKYAYLLSDEDAYNDLRLEFIEIIIKIDLNRIKNTQNGSLIAYLEKSFRNEYIKKARRLLSYQCKNYMVGEMPEKEAVKPQTQLSSTDYYRELDYLFLDKYLTRLEFETIILIFYYGYSVLEISKIKKVSRQAVNQLKNKAIFKLRKQLDTNLN